MYLRPCEAAQLLQVSTQTLASWHKKGLITAVVSPTGRRRYLRDDVNKLRETSKEQE